MKGSALVMEFDSRDKLEKYLTVGNKEYYLLTETTLDYEDYINHPYFVITRDTSDNTIEFFQMVVNDQYKQNDDYFINLIEGTYEK